MKNRYAYLNDQDFLVEISNLQIATFFIKINLLNWQEKIIEQIEGKATQANVYLDANSLIRRTANISLILQEEDKANLLSLNKKVSIEIGYENVTDKYKQFPILWFPLGVYVITNKSLTQSLDNNIVSLELKDKMVLLNGECGGTLPASVVFDNAETIDQNGNVIITRPTIYQIIRELVNHFGNQQLGKIIISDLDIRIKQVMKWTSTSPLYFLQKNGQYYMTIDADDYVSKIEDGYTDVEGSPFQYGENVGFIFTDFTYPGSLIGKPGDSVVDILETIKNTLGNYEFFYDLDGNFVFQQIKNYLNNSQVKYILDSMNNNQLVPDYLSATGESYFKNLNNGKAVFSFKQNNNLISSYTNQPNMNNIKNDFVIWGIRTGTDGYEIPIRYHLVIDQKPSIGNTYKVFKYVDLNDQFSERWYAPLVFDSINDFPETGVYGVFYLANNNNTIYTWKLENNLNQYVEINASIENVTTKDWRTQLYFQGLSAQPYGEETNFYYSQLLYEWPRLYNILPDYVQNGVVKNDSGFKDFVTKNPSGINYYLDFLDPRGNDKLERFSVNNIGRRSKIQNDEKDTNCVFQTWVPDIILIKIDTLQESEMSKMREECVRRSQNYYQVPEDIYNSLAIGDGLFSCYERIKQTIQEYACFNENISIQTLPLYFLDVNTCIEVQNSSNAIEGNYMIKSMSLNLSNSGMGTMIINALRQLEKI